MAAPLADDAAPRAGRDVDLLAEVQVLFLELCLQASDLGQRTLEAHRVVPTSHGVQEHLAEQAEPRSELGRPLPFALKAAHGQGRNRPAGQLQGNRQVGPEADRDAVGLLGRRLVRELLGQPRVGERLALQQLRQVPGRFLGHQLAHAPAHVIANALPRPLVCEGQLAAVLGELHERGAIHVQRLHDQPQALLDLLVYLGRRQTDEAGGEVGQKALERQPLADERIGLSVVHRSPPQECVSQLRRNDRVDLGRMNHILLGNFEPRWGVRAPVRPVSKPDRSGPTARLV